MTENKRASKQSEGQVKEIILENSNDVTAPTQNMSQIYQINSCEKKSKISNSSDDQKPDEITIKEEVKKIQENQSDEEENQDEIEIIQEIAQANTQYMQQQKSVDQILKEREWKKQREEEDLNVLQVDTPTLFEKGTIYFKDIEVNLNINCKNKKTWKQMYMTLNGPKLQFSTEENQINKADIYHDFRFNDSTVSQIRIIQNKNNKKNCCLQCVGIGSDPKKRQNQVNQAPEFIKEGILINVEKFSKMLKIQFQNLEDQKMVYEKLVSAAHLSYDLMQEVDPQMAKQYYNNFLSDAMTMQELKEEGDTADMLLITLSPTLCKLRRTFTGSVYDHVACMMNDIQGKWVFDIQDATNVQKVDFDYYMKYSSLVLNMSYRKIHYEDDFMTKDDFHYQCAHFLFKNYDAKFSISAGQLKRRNSGVEDCDQYFCSSFIAKMFKQLGALPEGKSASRYWPDAFSEKRQLKFEKGVSYGPEVKVIMPKDFKCVVEYKKNKYRSKQNKTKK